MLKSSTTKRLALTIALAASLGSALTGGSAGADPKQLTAAVGVGSDTTQDVMNAMTGFTNGINYTPIQSSAASNARQIISFDAVPPPPLTGACITTKTGAPTMNRPNGSSQGRRALSRAIDGTGYGTVLCGGPVNISGLVQFARSSAGPTAGDIGTNLTYVPFGRDGVSFAYYRASGGAPVTSLTKAQLTSLFTTGPQVIGGVRIVPCGIQTGSGTNTFWTTQLGVTASEPTATTECNNLLGVGVRAEENDGTALKARGDLVAAGDQVIIGFSAASFIAKSNLVAPGAPPAAVGMGAISDNGAGTNLGSPVAGSAPNLTASATFYNDATFGRDVYNVFPTAVIASAFGNDDLKTLFAGSTSAICQQSVTIQKFGFLAIATCGDLTLKGSLLVGQL